MTVNDGDKVELDENGLPPNKVNPDDGQRDVTHSEFQPKDGTTVGGQEPDEDTQPAK
mgnify:CR=1 FL=1|jgi:hypothetical protein